MIRYWVKEENLVREDASMDVSTLPGYVCVVKADDAEDEMKDIMYTSMGEDL